jgi:hypothetical protein
MTDDAQDGLKIDLDAVAPCEKQNRNEREKCRVYSCHEMVLYYVKSAHDTGRSLVVSNCSLVEYELLLSL